MNRRRSLFNSKTKTDNSLILYLDALQNTKSGNNPAASEWEDLSGHGNNGVFVGDVVYSDNSYQVNCTSTEPAYIQIDSSELLLSASKDFSFQVLFKTSDPCNVTGTTQGDTYNQLWTTSGTTICARYLYVRFPTTIPDTYELDVSGFTLFTVTYDSSKPELKYYFNDTLVYTATSSFISAVRYGITLGHRTGTDITAKNAQSNYAVVRYYTRALTADEVTANYEYDSSRYQ